MAFTIAEITENPQLTMIDPLADALANQEISLAQYTRAAMFVAEKAAAFETGWEKVKAMSQMAVRAGMGDEELGTFKRTEMATRAGAGLAFDLTDAMTCISLPPELAQLTAAKFTQYLGKSQTARISV